MAAAAINTNTPNWEVSEDWYAGDKEKMIYWFQNTILNSAI